MGCYGAYKHVNLAPILRFPDGEEIILQAGFSSEEVEESGERGGVFLF